ncbi:MAG: TonB family protein [Arcicella sp.]|nr:TonB family protein [Arcicella sp.]
MQNHLENPETLEDIIFRNRNKSYGAYSLRTDYQKVINRALVIGIGVFGLAILTPMIWAKVNYKEKMDKVYEVTDVDFPPPPKDEIVPPTKPETPPPSQVEQPRKTITFLAPEIVEDEKVEDEPIPDQDLLNNTTAQISNKTQEGSEDPIPVDDPDVGKGTEPAQPVEVKVDEKDEVHIVVEQMPEYAGGVAALSKFLQKNLRYPNPAASAGVSGKVFVQFVVGQDGAISKVDILKGMGFGCDEEAQRVIKLMPRWSAGKQSGRAVSVRFTLPINFQLE